ncbi:MAG TPA: hypothetical protein VIY48_10550 [Candidatus Paceibacterota bacterium]
MKYYYVLTIMTARGKMSFPFSIKTDAANPLEHIVDQLNTHNVMCKRDPTQISDISFGDGVISIVGFVDWLVAPQDSSIVTQPVT